MESTNPRNPAPEIFAAIAPVILFGLAAATIMVIQLFTHPILSIADNTDFKRMSAQVGILPPGPYPEGYFKYAHVKYPLGTSERIEYASTELPFCRLAKTLNGMFYSHDIFDIRFLGLVHACAYSASLCLFAYGIRLRPVFKSCILAFLLFVLVDDRLISYFNSFYSEGASIVFLLLTAAVMLSFYSASPTRGVTWTKLVSLMACSLLLAFSKAQNLILLLPLWGFGMCIALTQLKSRLDRHAWILVSVVIMLGGILFGLESRAFAATKNINIRTVLSEEIKPHTNNYINDLKEMHATKNDISRVTLGRIFLFYARHPQRYWDLLQRRAAKAFQYLPYGSFTKEESQRPGEQSSKFSAWWNFKSKCFPKNLIFILTVLVIRVLLGAYNYLHFLRVRGHWESFVGLVAATFSFMAAGAYVVAATFEANGPEKHLFIFNFLFDLVIIFSLLSAVSLFKMKSGSKKVGIGSVL